MEKTLTQQIPFRYINGSMDKLDQITSSENKIDLLEEAIKEAIIISQQRKFHEKFESCAYYCGKALAYLQCAKMIGAQYENTSLYESILNDLWFKG